MPERALIEEIGGRLGEVVKVATNTMEKFLLELRRVRLQLGSQIFIIEEMKMEIFGNEYQISLGRVCAIRGFCDGEDFFLLVFYAAHYSAIWCDAFYLRKRKRKRKKNPFLDTEDFDFLWER